MSKCSTIASGLNVWTVSSEPPFNNGRRDNVISPTTECWPKASEKVIEMGCHDPRSLLHYRTWSSNDERHHKHSPWQPDDVESDDEEGDLLAFVILGISVCDPEDQSCED